MDLKEFTQNAIRTESVVDQFKTNEQLLLRTLRTFIASGVILDQIKRQVYYGAELDQRKINSAANVMISESTQLANETDIVRVEQIETDDVLTINTRVAHGILGCLTEAVELGEAMDTWIKTGQLDAVNVQEEMGDTSWYHAILHDALDLDWDTGLNNIIAKLQKRFPEKFTQDNALNRDLDSEREVLEGKGS